MIEEHLPLDGSFIVTTADELSQVLHAQHRELSATLCRLPRLHDGAREDVFLQARRHLAVHTALEAAVVAPRMSRVPEHFRLDREVAAAEQGALETADFDAAHARLSVAFLHHVQVLERHDLVGHLSPPERSAVDAAVRLWSGEGDAYLGNTWADMVTIAGGLVGPRSDPAQARGSNASGSGSR